MRAFLRPLLLLLVVSAVVGGGTAYTVVRRGLSTRTPPSAVEGAVARTMRYLATPRQVRGQRNPVALTEDVRSEGREHFADHCASCHANDGRGDTAIGRALYPPAPDMRDAATQQLSDGELFSIIENGIRLTGMPAWGTGTAEGAQASWALVHFIRQLPALTPDDIEWMKAMNPRTLRQFQEEEASRRFLSGEDAPPARRPSPSPAASHQGGHHE